MSIESDILLAPEVEDDPSGYIASLITQAQQAILQYTRIATEWPEGEDADPVLDAACVRYVISLYRRGGTEQAQTLGVGSMSTTNYEMPPEVKMLLAGKRRCAWF
jgi:hypothetical protein